jgi:hypothetical protein
MTFISTSVGISSFLNVCVRTKAPYYNTTHAKRYSDNLHNSLSQDNRRMKEDGTGILVDDREQQSVNWSQTEN